MNVVGEDANHSISGMVGEDANHGKSRWVGGTTTDPHMHYISMISSLSRSGSVSRPKAMKYGFKSSGLL